MKKELPKAYEPQKYEDKIYKTWEESGFFNPDNLDVDDQAESYTIVLPPPNVTGTLHMGHAAMLAVEDILIRYNRMQGKRALWVPGTDHAAIATQTKVEKIIKEEGETRHTLGRDKFLKRVRAFAQESHDTIVNQVKKMGSSCDWSREAYTLDETRHQAVNSVFKLMYDDGLIYRGKRIVNWCPRCHSTLADDEVEYREEDAKLYWIKYGPFVLATARPETKLGDTAVAVHPKDKRYKDMVGKEYDIPGVLGEFRVKVVADRAVDMEFGSGAIKVTPAHSFVDNEIAERNGVGMRQIIDEDGKMMENCGKYQGMTTTEARKEIVKDMKKMGLIDHIEDDYKHNIAVCYRCDTPIEPLPSLQWFIDVNKPLRGRKQKTENRKQKIDWEGKSIKDVCLEVIKEGKIKIVPKRFEKSYFHWMENLRDWCISRQIWYGHQVPVWYRAGNREQGTGNNRDKEIYVGVEPPEDKTNFVFLHGFYRTREVKDPLNWLNQKLARKDNFWEILPKSEKPKLKEQMNYVIENAKINEDTIIVTHSLGGILAMKMIEEHDLKIKKLVLLSSPIIPKTKSKELIGYNKGNQIDFEKIKKNVKEIVVFQPYEDHVLPLEENEKLAKFLDAKLIKVEDSASHFNEDENQEILEELKNNIWTQDEDTLDTWFSSGMWTFSTLASSPDQIKIEDGKLVIDSEDFKNFHPTQVLETGYDILFFWVARMIIMTTYATGDIPFEDVYLHGLVLDNKGKKMSKSKGNVIDPLTMCEKYGTDATRLSLVIGSTPGHDLRLNEEKIAGYRNFANKLWNIFRYAIKNYELKIKNEKIDINKLSLVDAWIIKRIDDAINEVSNSLDNYKFSQAGEWLREFTWNELADWYLEAIKFKKSQETEKVLNYVLINLLKLWHPFIPFVTEVLWNNINSEKQLIISEWPKVEKSAEDKKQIIEQSNSFNLIKDIITNIRNARVVNKVEPGKKVKALVIAGKKKELIEPQADIIKGLRTGIEELEVVKSGTKPDKAIFISVGEIEIYLIGAVDEEKEKKRLKDLIERLRQLIKMTESKLSDKNFVERAPEPIVEKERGRLKEFKEEVKSLEKQLKSF
ncbi:class I tRNA ligase family protein [Candidatus Parcubacteria bacterium]|nr:class I tRNA ligase family protein [Candidatus Parcubacteria bacterium]